MPSPQNDTLRADLLTDLLIIGTGFAGLWAAIAAREAGVRRILLVDKAAIARSSQSRHCAGATIHALPEDDLDAWLEDIAAANDGLCRRDLVADLLATSHRRLARLEALGVEYARFMGGYARIPSRGLGRVAMMVAPRFGERRGGAAVVEALRRPALRGAKARARLMITGLVQAEGRVAGAVGVDRTTGAPVCIAAGAVVIATADCSFRGQYVGTRATTGDGFALGWRAGARLGNMEFLCVNTGSPDFGFEGTGIALRWGGRLLGSDGAPFMDRHHPDGDAAEVHHIVRAMAREADAGGGGFALDMGSAYTQRIGPALWMTGGFMPLNLRRLAEAGVDLSQPQPWGPVVQALHGGLWTDRHGATDVPGLFAAGTAAALDPGLFNGWSTFRAMGTGERAGQGAAAWLRTAGPAPAVDFSAALAEARAPLDRPGDVAPEAVVAAVQAELFRADVAILKRPERLRAALHAVEALEADAVPRLGAADPHGLAAAHEARNLVTVAGLYLRASLARDESRSAHFRVDRPALDPAGPYWITQRRGDGIERWEGMA